jgi:hypothetical protein
MMIPTQTVTVNTIKETTGISTIAGMRGGSTVSNRKEKG